MPTLVAHRVAGVRRGHHTTAVSTTSTTSTTTAVGPRGSSSARRRHDTRALTGSWSKARVILCRPHARPANAAALSPPRDGGRLQSPGNHRDPSQLPAAHCVGLNHGDDSLAGSVDQASPTWALFKANKTQISCRPISLICRRTTEIHWARSSAAWRRAS